MQHIAKILLMTALIPTFTFASCPPASSILISESDGHYNVSVPAGYTLMGEQVPISATGPIEFAVVNLYGTYTEAQADTFNFSAEKIFCWYGVGKTPVTGQYPNGIFIIGQIPSAPLQLVLPKNNWQYQNYYEILCTPLLTSANCDF